MLCQICHKNTAVLFVNRLENGQNKQIAMCLSCAQKHGFSLKNMMEQNGLKPEDMENIGEQMNSLMENLSEDGGMEALEKMFPPEMLNMMMGAAHPGEDAEEEMGIIPEDSSSAEAPEKPQKTTKRKQDKLKTLSKFGTNLTEKAAGGEIDTVVGRSFEIDRLMQILNHKESGTGG